MMHGHETFEDRSVVFDNRLSFARGKRHLTFELAGKRIRYAYIRKNGCSAFKEAMGFGGGLLADIPESYRARRLGRHDATIFVWRDPEERLVSLFRNKILDRNGADDLIRRYGTTMREAPGCFERFVEFAGQFADPHCLPQAAHLKPLRYTHAVPLASLHATMVGIVGEAAAAVFAAPVNRSRPTPVEVSPRARARIHEIYAADYALIGKLRARAGLQRA